MTFFKKMDKTYLLADSSLDGVPESSMSKEKGCLMELITVLMRKIVFYRQHLGLTQNLRDCKLRRL